MWQVIGQPRAVELLERSLSSGQLSHAYLFLGPPHIGKMTLAVSLAQAVNCIAEDRPCGACNSCLRIAAGKHADVQVIRVVTNDNTSDGRPKKEISIDQIREMERSANLRPYEGKCRVFIIDGAERLNADAANCLLKTLEEPPPQVLIILLALDERLLLPTVLSRCQRVDFRPLFTDVLEEALVVKWGVTPEKARVLAHLSGGCPGWALTAHADDRLLVERSERLDRLVSLVSAGRGERFGYASDLATRFSKDRDSVLEELALWLGWWRDLLLARGGCGIGITNIDREEEILSEAKGFSLARIAGFIGSLRCATEQLDQNANPRLVLEVLMLSIPSREGGKVVPASLAS